MMVRIKELQRRLDQTLGKPGQYTAIDKQNQSMTIGSRMCRVEGQLNNMEKQMSKCVNLLEALVLNSAGQDNVRTAMHPRLTLTISDTDSVLTSKTIVRDNQSVLK
uniref:Uncharacterized protein n=1 Tax=Romanomermis culicivorax TaxID=13658 RepID=A0A915J464_ROMCU